MTCTVCQKQPEKYGFGGRCSRCYAWWYRHGVERPSDAIPFRPERGRGMLACNACGEPLADHEMPPPCPAFDGRAAVATRRRQA